MRTTTSRILCSALAALCLGLAPAVPALADPSPSPHATADAAPARLTASGRVDASGNLTVTGKLDTESGPLAGKRVVILVDGQDAAEATTGSDGAYSTTVPASGVAIGSHDVTVLYSVAGEDPTTTTITVIRTQGAPPKLVAKAAPSSVAPGRTVTVSGTLFSGKQPLTGAEVDVLGPGGADAPFVLAFVKPEGTWSTVYPVPRAQPAGPLSLRVVYSTEVSGGTAVTIPVTVTVVRSSPSPSPSPTPSATPKPTPSATPTPTPTPSASSAASSASSAATTATSNPWTSGRVLALVIGGTLVVLTLLGLTGRAIMGRRGPDDATDRFIDDPDR